MLGIDLGRSFFQHVILIVQDLLNNLWAYTPTDQTLYFQNFRIYIGDDQDWSKNTECAGGPFMTIGSNYDGSGWFDDPKAASDG